MSIPLFYSYSHKDEPFRETLETHLAILKRQGFIEGWHDRRIAPGDNWEEEINLNLQNARVTLLLVSSNFLASDYCYDTETIFSLEQHENGACIVIPIILKPCLWTKSHFKHLQALPKDGKPITTWTNEDEAWLDVAEGILKVVEKINSKPKSIAIKGDGNVAIGGNTTIDRKPSGGMLEGLSGENPEEESDSWLSEGDKPGGKIPEELESEIYRFLSTYHSWYFSPLRIQKWGGKQTGFESLSEFDTYSIKTELENLLRSGKVKTTKSQKGNPIYKINGK